MAIAGPVRNSPAVWAPTAAALLALALGGCAGEAGGAPPQHAAGAGAAPAAQVEPPEEDSIAVRTQAAEQRALSAVYSTSATLRADRRATVTARTRGVIEDLLVEEGDRVRAGQPLAVLENDEQTIELARAETTRDNTARELARAENLREQELLSEEDYDAILRSAEEAKHGADLAALMLSRTVIRAPFDGRILKRHLDDGGNVSDGSAVYDLADLDPLYADVGVPERQIARLGVGQQVRLVVDSTGEEADGVIERLAPEVDAATGTVKVTVAVHGAPALRPGGFVRVDIVVDTHDDAVVVPRSALVAEGRRWHLFRVLPDGGKVERLEVERGFEEGDLVEIERVVAPGEPLRPGDPIVVVGAAALSDGSTVEVLDASDDATRAEDAEPREEPGVAA